MKIQTPFGREVGTCPRGGRTVGGNHFGTGSIRRTCFLSCSTVHLSFYFNQQSTRRCLWNSQSISSVWELALFSPCSALFFFLMIRRPPRSTLFPEMCRDLP